MVRLAEVIAEAKSIARNEALFLLEVDQTDYAVSLRLLIDREIYIQIYANETSDKLNLALVMRGNRIYGFDREGGLYHLHPFMDSHQHLLADSPKVLSNL